jgi:hypothetical protein
MKTRFAVAFMCLGLLAPTVALAAPIPGQPDPVQGNFRQGIRTP